MFTLADLNDPSAVLSFRSEAAAREACAPALAWLAFVLRQGRTLAQALDEAALTSEGRGWCAWCRGSLADLMDEDVRLAFSRAALSESQGFVWHFNPPPHTTAQERFLYLSEWHSGGGKVSHRRICIERREALR